MLTDQFLTYMLVRYVAVCADGHVAPPTALEERSFGVTITNKRDKTRGTASKRRLDRLSKVALQIERSRRSGHSVCLGVTTGGCLKCGRPQGVARLISS